MNTRIGSDLREIPIEDDDEYDGYYDDDDEAPTCSWCGGEGIQENHDPLWYGFDRDWIPCEACNGRGHSQTIW